MSCLGGSLVRSVSGWPMAAGKRRATDTTRPIIHAPPPGQNAGRAQAALPAASGGRCMELRASYDTVRGAILRMTSDWHAIARNTESSPAQQPKLRAVDQVDVSSGATWSKGLSVASPSACAAASRVLSPLTKINERSTSARARL